MKAILYVFSGTGNTRLVAGLYKKFLDGFDTTIFDIRMKKTTRGFCYCAEGVDAAALDIPRGAIHPSVPHPNDFDLVGFGCPIHGFNAPKVMVDFAKALPQASGKKSFIFKSSGEGLSLNNYSSQRLIKILSKKGFVVLSERHFVMPYNMIFRHTPEMVKSEWIYAQALAKSHAAKIARGEAEKVKLNPLKGWFVPILRIEWIYAQAQGPFMKADMKKCVKCLKCVRGCPMQNISLRDGKIKFGSHCALCVCCSFGCPVKAISIGLLNGWRVNGDYNIEKTAADPSVAFPHFTESLRGLERRLYLKYYRALDEELSREGISLAAR